ncbi:MAG: hypothetical protein K9H62_13815 [Bacteroidales bacterium]|nr:hypothetical protein [Bacteroidales bacterium]
MKKILYISGIVAVNLLLLGALMKILHWPGANILLILSIATFVFWFIPASLINHFRSLEKPANPTLHILVFVVCLLDFVGALFKILHWPGANWLMIVGIPAPFILFLPVYLIRFNKQKRRPDGDFFAVMFLFVYIAIISVFLSLQVGKEVIDYGVMTGEKSQVTYANLDALSSDRVGDSAQNKIQEKADELCRNIDQIKAALVETYQQDASDVVKSNGEINLWKMKGIDGREASKIYFCDENGGGNLGKFFKEVEDFREYLIEFIPVHEKQKRDFVNETLRTSHIFYKPDMPLGSPGINLANMSLMMVINQLTFMQTNIRLAELQVL